jgi:hypothetical protein
MQVDEPRRNDHADCVDRRAPLNGCRRHRANHTRPNADVPHGVEVRFGIDDPTTEDDGVEELALHTQHGA